MLAHLNKVIQLLMLPRLQITLDQLQTLPIHLDLGIHLRHIDLVHPSLCLQLLDIILVALRIPLQSTDSTVVGLYVGVELLVLVLEFFVGFYFLLDLLGEFLVLDYYLFGVFVHPLHLVDFVGDLVEGLDGVFEVVGELADNGYGFGCLGLLFSDYVLVSLSYIDQILLQGFSLKSLLAQLLLQLMYLFLKNRDCALVLNPLLQQLLLAVILTLLGLINIRCDLLLRVTLLYPLPDGEVLLLQVLLPLAQYQVLRLEFMDVLEVIPDCLLVFVEESFEQRGGELGELLFGLVTH